MPRTPLVIVGAGGYGREVLRLVRDIDAVSPTFDFLGFLDDGEITPGPLERIGATVLGGSKRLGEIDASYVIGIGTYGSRRKVDAMARSMGRTAATICHPSSVIGDDIRLGEGAIISAFSHLTTDIVVGRHSVINVHCTIGHDVVIGDVVTIHPGVHISGSVVIEDDATLGTGSVILPESGWGPARSWEQVPSSQRMLHPASRWSALWLARRSTRDPPRAEARGERKARPTDWRGRRAPPPRRAILSVPGAIGSVG